MQIQTVLIHPSYNSYNTLESKSQYFKKENNKVTKLTQDQYWKLYDKSIHDKSIEILPPITKE